MDYLIQGDTGSYENKSDTKHMITLGLQTEVLNKPIWQNRYYDLNVSPKNVYVALLNPKSDGIDSWAFESYLSHKGRALINMIRTFIKIEPTELTSFFHNVRTNQEATNYELKKALGHAGVMILDFQPQNCEQ